MGLKDINRPFIAAQERWVRKEWRLGEEAKDVVAESLANALASGELAAVQCPESYVRSAIRNELCDHHRKRKVRERAAADELKIETEPQCSGMEVQCMKEDLLWKVLRELPAEEREVLLLRTRDGQTFTQIAQQLGKSYSTVYRLFNTATARCTAIAARLKGDEK